MKDVLMDYGNVNDKLMNKIAENLTKHYTENIKTEEVSIVPCNMGVLIKFYEDNPYRAMLSTTKSGLIIGAQSTQRYKSNETGEMEENDEFVACAEVIAVGPKCENVKVGEDVFVIKHIANPVPIRKQSLYIISESNILCRVYPKSKDNE